MGLILTNTQIYRAVGISPSYNFVVGDELKDVVEWALTHYTNGIKKVEYLDGHSFFKFSRQDIKRELRDYPELINRLLSVY